VKGRKRHILVDTLGLLLAVLVNPANISDAAGAIELMARVKGVLVRLGIVYADGAYAYDSVADACRSVNNARLMVVKRTDPGFKVLPKRWIVERSLAWLGRNRRLSKDYEQLPQVSEAFVKIAMVRLMIARLA
jgi:putative transposase